VKLIRSKGVGVYFVTQNPLDVPESVLAQMGNRVQHALRAYTPREQKAVRTAAETFRANPKFDTQTAITELGKGEALVSVLDLKGVPTMVERTMIRPPCGRMGPITPEERKQVIANSPVYGEYENAVDRESAFEILQEKAKKAAEAKEQAAAEKAEARPTRASASGSQRETATDRFVKNVAGSVGRTLGTSVARQLGNALIRGILGGLTRK
jgi:DNA helicase HerA-like ATPase